MFVPERHDWRWYVKLPGDRLLVVPVDERGAERLLRERRLLAALGPRVGFAVPRPIGEVDAALDLRQRVPGETGIHLHWAMLEDAARAERYADDLAWVLAELHGALTAEELAELADAGEADAYPLPAARLRPIIPSLPEEIHGRVGAAIDLYAEVEADGPDLVLVHGDLGTHNLSFDPVTGRVVGLFDFEGFARRDRHRDFHYLPSYGPRVMARVLAGYRERTGVEIEVERMRLMHLATALSFWAWREQDPEAHDRLSSRNREQALAWVGFALFALDPR